MGFRIYYLRGIEQFMNNIIRKQSNIVSKNGAHTKIWMKFAILYSTFLFIILILASYLHNATAKISSEEFWFQNQSTFHSAVTLLDNDLILIESYCRQLTQDNTFLSMASAEDSTESRFYLNGFSLKNGLPSYLATYPGIPVNSYFIYLRNTGYVASINSFKSESLYYVRNYIYKDPDFDTWKEYINAENGTGTMRFIAGNATNSNDDSYLYLIDMDVLSYKDIPVTAGFHISYEKLKDIFSGVSLENGGCLLVLDETNTPVFYFTEDKTDRTSIADTDYASLPEKVTVLSYNNGTASLSFLGQKMRVTQNISSINNWTYYLIQPDSLSTVPYQGFFSFLLIIAGIAGLFMVYLLATNSIRPIERLGFQLQETISDRNQLQEVVNATKPIIYSNYLHRLMSGTVSTPEESAYIQSFLHLEQPNLRFYVMYGIIYENAFMDNGDAAISENTDHDIEEMIRGMLAEYFSYNNMLYLFSPKERVYTLLLPFEGDEEEMLIQIQKKVLEFHTKLLEEHSIWFFTGIGLACTFSNIWESYQQAKDASEYTSKNYIFLPYEMLKKNSQVYYYPVEFSSRMIQFITTGSKPQVIELFSLIHKENIEERSLPFQLLRFLLSDIRNTLLRARFTVTTTTAENAALLAEVDEQLSVEEPTFRSCEDIAIKLCDLFHVKSEKSTLIDTIVEYIRKNFKDPSLCLNKISDEFNISESYFSHMFKENMNVNFSVYLEDLRLNEAARLIQEGDANLTAISEAVGYNNITSFRRAFKKKFGITPSAMSTN